MKRWLPLVAMIFGLLILAISIPLLIQRRQPSQARYLALLDLSPAQLSRINADGTGFIQLDTRRQLDFLGISQQGQWLLYTTRHENSNRDVLYRVSPNGQVKSTTTLQPDETVFLAPDGDWLYSWHNGTQLYRADLDNHQLERLADIAPAWSSLIWSLDNMWLFYSGLNNGEAYLYRVRVDGSEKSPLFPLEDRTIYHWMLTEDGDYLYLDLRIPGLEAGFGEPFPAHRINVNDGTALSLGDLPGDMWWIAVTPDTMFTVINSEISAPLPSDVFQSRIYAMRLEDMQPVPLTANEAFYHLNSWQWQNGWLIYTQVNPAAQRESIMRLRVEELPPQQVIEVAGSDLQWQIVDGGRRIIYSYKANVDQFLHISIMHSDGSHPREIAVLDGSFFNWFYTTNARHVILSYFDQADPRLAVFDLQKNTWTVLPAQGFPQAWSPIIDFNWHGMAFVLLATILLASGLMVQRYIA